MTNPNNAIGTNAAYGGRTSPNAFNDVLGAFAGRGILSGWQCSPNTGMSVVLGGDGEHRDVAIAEDNAGNKLTVDNISEEPIPITIAAAPASQSRIDAIVVYVTNPPQGTSSATDNYGTVGVLDVQGATSGSPVAPNDSDIRTAITADGQSGANAYYVVLAYVTVGTGTTDITSDMIAQGDMADLQTSLVEIADGSITGDKLTDATITGTKIANNTIGGSKINWSSVCTTTDYSDSASGNSWTLKEYKYADGTMELWGVLDFGSITHGQIDSITITYPTAFIQAPMIIVGLISGSVSPALGSFSVGYVPDNYTTSGVFRCYNGSTEDRNGAGSFIARGRWK